MSVIGIVCEFNPFHNGHKHLIDSVKKEGDTVVCVMSGNFVQRGEPAVIPKEIRTKAALLNGADIVLELPFIYATASAELFAYSAVKILNDFGCEIIAFGTESEDVASIEAAADILLSEDFEKQITSELEKGVSYPVARQTAFNKYNNAIDISSPNNILAVEYIKAIRKQHSKMKPVTVKRKGAGYNDETAIDNFASATCIRKLINQKNDYSEFIPDNAVGLYCDTIEKGYVVSEEKFNIAALSLLRSSMNNNLSEIANISEGLENRIVEAIKANVTLKDIYDCVKTKRYTHSRVRRAVLSVAMNVKEADLKIRVPYCRLLGYRKTGSTIMGNLAKNSKLPFVVTYSDVLAISTQDAKRVFELENRTTDFYNLILENPLNCSTEMTFRPVKM